MWEVAADKVKAAGGTVEMQARLTTIHVERRPRPHVTVEQGGTSNRRRRARHLDHADA